MFICELQDSFYLWKRRIKSGVADTELQAFQAVNSLCLKYYNLSRSTRALEMIVQAYWVECYEARILAVKEDNPTKSSTEANMEALKEACSVFGWSEKELRNKLYDNFRFSFRLAPELFIEG